jgi:hypothetical protein
MLKLGVLDIEVERKLAATLYNEVWRLMDLPDRTAEQDDTMLHAAHASRYHWGRVGMPVNVARGEWLCARVYAILGRAEPAMWHARRSLSMLETFGGEVWDVAAAYEALARACTLEGDDKGAREWSIRARELVETLADQADRSRIESDLADLG